MSKKLTNSSGIPYFEHQDSQTVGARGPVLLQDFILQENLAHFVRERIPERIVHAKGTGAYGKFTVTHDITKYTRAKLFSKVGNTCRMFARFSTVAGEKGSADTARDPRGFALKFYTEDGNWDLVGNNTPVFFIKDAKKFPDFIYPKKTPKNQLEISYHDVGFLEFESRKFTSSIDFDERQRNSLWLQTYARFWLSYFFDD